MDRNLETLSKALAHLQAGFAHQDEQGGGFEDLLLEVAERLRDNYPYHDPMYAGQMIRPPHPVARVAYALTQWINPNNHALDGGRASSEMESEAVAELAAMFGWQTHLGHLTSGGTEANLEALWVARELKPGVVLASEQAHYTHERMAGVLSVPFEAVACGSDGRMDLSALQDRLEQGGVSVVVATAGTTGLGAVDPIGDIVTMCQNAGVRLHVDAAYGGYFGLASGLEPGVQRHFEAIGQAASVVIDPHKHGFQPYGCGCVLFRDPAVGAIYQHDSPYTYFTSDALHLGEITLACSRPGAAAVALWATQKHLPLKRGGALAAGLHASLEAASALWKGLPSQGYQVGPVPDLDIVVFAAAGCSFAEMSAESQRVFEAAAHRGLHLALFEVPAQLAGAWWPSLEADQQSCTVLRSVLMKPSHLAAIPRILEVLGDCLRHPNGSDHKAG